MEILVILGGLIVATVVAILIWPVVAGIAVIAFLSWLIGIPFWVGLIIGGGIALVGLVVTLSA